MQTTGYHHAALTVTDLARSAAWYEDLLDLELLFEEAGDDRRAHVYRIAGTPTVLGLVQHLGADDAPFDPRRTGLDHLALSVATRADVDAFAAGLDARGIAHSGAIDLPAGAILNFADPDGIALSVFWDAAG